MSQRCLCITDTPFPVELVHLFYFLFAGHTFSIILSPQQAEVLLSSFSTSAIPVLHHEVSYPGGDSMVQWMLSQGVAVWLQTHS